MPNTNGDALYNWLLQQELQGDDDRRFYSSYLLGHVSLAIADTDNQPEQFFDRLNQGLKDTIPEDKLSEKDIEGIHALLAEGLK
ncbi:YfcL family protein [Neptunomonas sp.]|uniref:YfcL family protein n=1 Tax=Neptunomonas sp. TaxID=1971898 RepID=UPI0025FE3966|nr:YfcL family protein [Neptunomonas sp.]